MVLLALVGTPFDYFAAIGMASISSPNPSASSSVAAGDNPAAFLPQCVHSRKRIAVVGSGIAGLTAAYLLSESPLGHEVVIYEAASHLGMDSNGITLGSNYASGAFKLTDDANRCDAADSEVVNGPPSPAGEASAAATSPEGPRVRVDVPLRVFTESYYPHLTALYDRVGVEYQAENYESSFSCLSGSTLFAYKNVIIGPFSLPYINPLSLAGIAASSMWARARALVGLSPSSSDSTGAAAAAAAEGAVPSFSPLSREFWVILRDLLRFLRESHGHLTDGTLHSGDRMGHAAALVTPASASASDVTATATKAAAACIGNEGPTLLEYLRLQRYSSAFTHRFVLPMMASICTCTTRSAADYPAWVVVQYLVTRSWRGVRRARGGAQEIVHKLVRRCADVRLNRRITQVTTIAANATDTDAAAAGSAPALAPAGADAAAGAGSVRVRLVDSTGAADTFDHVVFATQANQSVAILRGGAAAAATAPSEARLSLEAALSRIPYESSRLVLHTDPALMPGNRADWRSVNFILPDSLDELSGYATVPSPAAVAAAAAAPTADGGVAATTAATPATAAAAAGGSETLGAMRLDLNVTMQLSVSAGSGSPQAQACPDDSVAGATGAAAAGSSLSGANSTATAAAPRNLDGYLSPARVAAIAAIEREGMASIWMNRVQHGLRTDTDIFQTWNPLRAPAPAHTIAVSAFERPVVTFDSLRATQELWRLQGTDGIWFVGSYSVCGVPLLETAVSSAVQVAAALGAPCPWMSDAQVREAVDRAYGRLPPPRAPWLRQCVLACAAAFVSLFVPPETASGAETAPSAALSVAAHHARTNAGAEGPEGEESEDSDLDGEERARRVAELKARGVHVPPLPTQRVWGAAAAGDERRQHLSGLLPSFAAVRGFLICALGVALAAVFVPAPVR
jgi:predicted NAD/FAD-binding protein